MPQYTEDQLRQALEDISNGKSQKRASLEYGIPRSTLQLRLQGGQTRRVAFSDWQRLSPDQETKLAQWVRIQASLGLAPTHQQRSRSIDSRRVNGASTEVIRNWFKFLAIPEIKDIKPANRYNMDETGILEGQGANGLVLGMAETTSVRKKQPGSRAWVSIIECISALGRALRPLTIFKGKTVQQQWFPLHLVPYDGWEFTATDNGWTTDLTAIEWLEKVFIPQTMPETEGEARLLIVDGHGSHTTTDFMWNCYINNIHLLFLPPHSSHVLQPLDQSVFSPVKSAYRKELGYLSQWNDSTIIGKRNFLDCYQKARLAGLSVSNIRSGWKWTGLHPVALVKPLMNPMVLPEPPAKPTTPKTTSQGRKRCHNGQQTTPVEPWDSASSAVVWSTPRKLAELSGQLHLYTQLDNDTSTQRLLFRKVKKGFTEQAWQLAAAQQQLAQLRAQVTNAAVRKRKTVQIDPNTKFANIRDIHRAQIEAGEKEVITAESSDSECPSEAGSCIVVGVVEDQ
ncbi:transposase [Colletotrichum abscissum]|uniref:Transposase n=1 Tax=Colletotrichum abscissum TaxID=1671311 RepID=A0A9P9X265_9PEZI|nr:transposase [Colletotrichum abscissum]